MARRLLALFGEQSFIFVQDLNTSLHKIQKTPLTRSGFETMFLHCIKSARFDARLHESPSNILYIWLLMSVTRAQPHAPSRLLRGDHGLIPEQRPDTEPTFYMHTMLRISHREHAETCIAVSHLLSLHLLEL